MVAAAEAPFSRWAKLPTLFTAARFPPRLAPISKLFDVSGSGAHFDGLFGEGSLRRDFSRCRNLLLSELERLPVPSSDSSLSNFAFRYPFRLCYPAQPVQCAIGANTGCGAGAAY